MVLPVTPDTGVCCVCCAQPGGQTNAAAPRNDEIHILFMTVHYSEIASCSREPGGERHDPGRAASHRLRSGLGDQPVRLGISRPTKRPGFVWSSAAQPPQTERGTAGQQSKKTNQWKRTSGVG